jgi:site-specific recombinase XerD
MSSSVKQRLIEDLQMSGLAARTQKAYLDLVVRFVRQTGIRPQDATEAQVADYLRGLIRAGRCQGTIASTRGALRFVFEDTLGRKWRLFKKRSLLPAASVCPRLPPTMSAAA